MILELSNEIYNLLGLIFGTIILINLIFHFTDLKIRGIN